MARHMGTVNLFIQMEQPTTELGSSIKLTVLEYFNTPNNRDMKVSGKMIFSMVLEKRPGLTAQIIKETLNLVKKTVKVLF